MILANLSLTVILVTMVTAEIPADVNAWSMTNNDVEDKELTATGETLRYNIFASLRDYYCEVQSPACNAIKANLLSHRLAKEKITCLESDSDQQGLCGEARSLLLLIDPAWAPSPREDFKVGLIKAGDRIMKSMFGPTFSVLDGIRDAIVNLICMSEPEEVCDMWR